MTVCVCVCVCMFLFCRFLLFCYLMCSCLYFGRRPAPVDVLRAVRCYIQCIVITIIPVHRVVHSSPLHSTPLHSTTTPLHSTLLYRPHSKEAADTESPASPCVWNCLCTCICIMCMDMCIVCYDIRVCYVITYHTILAFHAVVYQWSIYVCMYVYIYI